MSQDDELIVHAEVMDIAVQIEVADVVVELEERPEVVIALVSNMGPPGPKGETGDEGPDLLPEHIASELPHPVYDEGPSLTLLYENAKV